MKLIPFEKIIAMSKEGIDAAMAPIRQNEAPPPPKVQGITKRQRLLLLL